MSTILGFHSHNVTGAAIVQEGKIISAVNEERLNRIKGSDAFPERSIREVMWEAGITSRDIDVIALGDLKFKAPAIGEYLKRLFQTSPRHYYHILGRIKHVWSTQNACRKANSAFIEKNFPGKKTEHVEHHIGHAASAHFTSGNDKNVIVTIDGWGDKLSSGTYMGERERIERVYYSYDLDSLGYFYSRVTVALGFKPHRHEGKITGLAAYGNPPRELREWINKIGAFDKKTMRLKFNLGEDYLPTNSVTAAFKQKIFQFKREDVAAAAQEFLERVAVEYITTVMEQMGTNHLVLAGGTFANVKLNQQIKDIKGVRSIFIHPNMGDEGLCLGGALDLYNKKVGYMNVRLKDVYFGPEYGNEEIKKELEKYGLEYQKMEHLEYQVAELLAKGKVVARFKGRMEYGPRALGNRTILYQTQDKSVNDWLNKHLKRTEFMPFAPVTLSEYAAKCYKDVKGAEYAAKFMTITFDCTDWMKDTSPGVVHVDGTARPQLIDKETNPSYYKIVDEYRKITGVPSLINTSFNMHEEPIVCSPSDAIRAFLDGHLDYLAIGSYLVKGKA
jgi:carbamoyltransferase